jgi:hypothetical protein
VPGAVVKLQLRAVPSGLPAASATLAATLAVYFLPAARSAAGSSVKLAPSPDTAAATAAPPSSTSVNPAAPSDAGLIASSKVTVTLALAATPVAFSAGDRPVIAGGSTSIGAFGSSWSTTGVLTGPASVPLTR